MHKTLFISFILVFATACNKEKSSSPTKTEKNSEAKTAAGSKDQALRTEALENFKPLRDSAIDLSEGTNQLKVDLGKRLYFEKQLSLAGDISCNSCHMLDKFGVDNEPTSPGHKGQRGDRNSPTVYNAALHIAQFWDGRAADVEAQAIGPILNPIEMAIPDEKTALDRLKALDGYVASFKKAFKDGMTYKNIGNAIGAFERTLLTPSPFDRWLKGDDNALTAKQKAGLRNFMDVGCIACHNGEVIGGNSYQMIGAIVPYETEDLGRYNVTKDEDDKKFFKVPSLRNVAKTGPYFHDGKVKTLKEAITLMAKHQLDEKLSNEQLENIEAFLESLTGTLPKITAN